MLQRDARRTLSRPSGDLSQREKGRYAAKAFSSLKIS
jgi:hypothetical protein